jgi:hypothetical protein
MVPGIRDEVRMNVKEDASSFFVFCEEGGVRERREVSERDQGRWR